MENQINYITKDTYNVTHWSGGKTSQICLSPANGAYKVGEFDYRISSATIALNETVFSELSGYRRIIMSLNQPITLYHGGESVELLPFVPHHFSGEIETKSVGTCTDFNLIYKPNFYGDMKVYSTDDRLKIIENRHYIIYAINYFSYYNQQGKRVQIKQGDSVQFEATQNEVWRIEADDTPACVVVEVYQL